MLHRVWIFSGIYAITPSEKIEITQKDSEGILDIAPIYSTIYQEEIKKQIRNLLNLKKNCQNLLRFYRINKKKVKL